MNQHDLNTFLKSLGSRPGISLPRHEQGLRQQLLAQHATQQAAWFRFARALPYFLIGVVTVMRNKRSILSGVGISAVVLGALTFASLTNLPVSAHDLATKAADKMSTMDQGTIESKNRMYQQNLKERLNEAKKAPSLRIIEIAELNSWGIPVQQKSPEVVKYLTYTDAQQHRIVVGLGADNEPMMIMDVELFDKSKGVNMDVKVPSSGSSLQGQSTANPNQR